MRDSGGPVRPPVNSNSNRAVSRGSVSCHTSLRASIGCRSVMPARPNQWPSDIHSRSMYTAEGPTVRRAVGARQNSFPH